ncbi:MAG: HEPN domain-containing protein, partial [Janthinobacterium lividum]
MKPRDDTGCAFLSHQATESFYNAILLVFSNYKPKLHNIKKLASRAKNYSSELLQVFPIVTSEQKKCFELLEKAYVDARYDKNYKITKEQL